MVCHPSKFIKSEPPNSHCQQFRATRPAHFSQRVPLLLLHLFPLQATGLRSKTAHLSSMRSTFLRSNTCPLRTLTVNSQFSLLTTCCTVTAPQYMSPPTTFTPPSTPSSWETYSGHRSLSGIRDPLTPIHQLGSEKPIPSIFATPSRSSRISYETRTSSTE